MINRVQSSNDYKQNFGALVGDLGIVSRTIEKVGENAYQTRISNEAATAAGAIKAAEDAMDVFLVPIKESEGVIPNVNVCSVGENVKIATDGDIGHVVTYTLHMIKDNPKGFLGEIVKKLHMAQITHRANSIKPPLPPAK